MTGANHYYRKTPTTLRHQDLVTNWLTEKFISLFNKYVTSITDVIFTSASRVRVFRIVPSAIFPLLQSEPLELAERQYEQSAAPRG